MESRVFIDEGGQSKRVVSDYDSPSVGNILGMIVFGSFSCPISAKGRPFPYGTALYRGMEFFRYPMRERLVR